MTYHYTYNITCLCGSLKDHYYLGQHTTDNLDDGYAGSGKILKNYYKKYGAIENVTYIKTIVGFYSNLTELGIAEYELIGDKYETDPMCLNIVAGGSQIPWNKGKHFSDEQKQNMSDAASKRFEDPEERQKISKSKMGSIPWNKGKKGCYSEETKQKWSKKRKGRKFSEEYKQNMSKATSGEKNGMYGKHQSEETKEKIRMSKSGTKYVNNGIKNAAAKGEKLQQLLNEGYVYGMLKRNKNTQ